jgi:hypothetical protein
MNTTFRKQDLYQAVLHRPVDPARLMETWHLFRLLGVKPNSGEPVTKREIGFLLIGLAFGLMLAVAGILEVLLSLYRSAFITGYSWDKLFVVVPILLLAIGLVLILYRPQREQAP